MKGFEQHCWVLMTWSFVFDTTNAQWESRRYPDMGCTRHYPNSSVRCVHAPSFFPWFLQTYLQVSSSPTKKVQVSTANLLQTDLGYQLKFTRLHFCLDFKLGPWYEFILWHPPSHLPYFFKTPCGQKFLASMSLGCFVGEERRLQNPRSVGKFLLG